MKTRNRKPEKQEKQERQEPVSEPVSAATENSAATSSPESKKERINLSFDIKADGTPDYSSMRQSTREKLRTVFSDPALADFIGAPRVAEVEVQIFHPAMISGMYDMLGAVEAMLAQRVGKIPETIAKRVFTYTSAEKDALAGPTVRVLNKYAAAWMIKYQDEIALATLLGSLTVAKVNAAITLTKMSQVKRAEEPEKEPGQPDTQLV